MQATLEMMLPGGFYQLLSVRRAKVISAIAALAENVRDLPAIVSQLHDGTRQLRVTLPLTRRTGEVPLSIILEYLVGAAFDVYALLATAKRKGYNISRHPAFMTDLGDEQEEELARGLSLLMEIHQAALMPLPDALAAYARAAGRVNWHARAFSVSAAQRMVCELRKSSTLPVGRSLCHGSFEPPESP